MTSNGTGANPGGRFVWFDLLTTDPAAAISFYTKLVGWEIQVWPGEVPYSMWATNGAPIGGVGQLTAEDVTAGAHPSWRAYITTPDADATTAAATQLGGRVVVPPQSIPTVGRFATLADPQGAVFAAFTQETPSAEREGPIPQGEFSWHELATSDAVAAFEFYRTLFGWQKTSEMDMGAQGKYQMFGRGTEVLGGIYNAAPNHPQPPAWLHYIRVADVDRSALQIPRLGAKVTNGPMDVPGGSRILQGLDPQGGAFAIHSGG